MKNFLLTLTILGLLVSSCTKDDFTTNQPEVNQHLQTDVYVQNGLLHLPENYIPIVDSVLALPIDERIDWEKSLGFTSYFTECGLVYDQLDKANSWEEYVDLVNSNSTLFSFAEDSTLNETVKTSFFQAIANKNKEFVIGNSLYKVEGNGIYKMMGSEPKLAMAFDHHADIKLKCGRTSNLNGVTYSNDYFCSFNCINGVESGKSYDEIGPSGRHIRFSFKIYRINLMSSNYVNSYRFDVNLKGYKKSWGRYRSYRTKYYYQNLRGKYLSYDVRGVSASLPNGLPWYSLENFSYLTGKYSPKTSSYTWTFPVYVDESYFNATLYTAAQLTEPWFDSFHIECGSRGTGYTYYTFDKD